MKKITLGGIGLAFLCLSLFSTPAQARAGWSVGAIGMGNFFLTRSNPDLKIGPGGGLFFEYRFNQRWGIETDFFITVHNGQNASTGDNGIYFLGVPSLELKFYMLPRETWVDPYVLVGLGVYVLTEGSISNNTAGAGLGGNVGLGVDFYVLKNLSIGLAAKFRPIAIIQGNSQSTGLINFGMAGNVAFHFGGP